MFPNDLSYKCILGLQCQILKLKINSSNQQKLFWNFKQLEKSFFWGFLGFFFCHNGNIYHLNQVLKGKIDWFPSLIHKRVLTERSLMLVICTSVWIQHLSSEVFKLPLCSLIKRESEFYKVRVSGDLAHLVPHQTFINNTALASK